jgi:hypothetical protein
MPGRANAQESCAASLASSAKINCSEIGGGVFRDMQKFRCGSATLLKKIEPRG